MKHITIEYPPIPRLKFTRTIKGSFPQTIEELTAKQLIAVACLVKGVITNIDFLKVMTGIKKRTLKKLDDYQLFNLMELFVLFNNPVPFHKFIINEITNGDITLYAPKQKLKAVTFAQFIFADTYFSDYKKKTQEPDLHKFVASFYLPANKKFSEEIMEASLPMVKKVNPQILEAIVLNYYLLREWLSEVYPLVFVKAEEETENETATNNPKPKTSSSANGWIKIFDSFVSDDIVNSDKYADLPFNNVLRHLSKRIKENMKRK